MILKKTGDKLIDISMILEKKVFTNSNAKDYSIEN